MTGATESFPFAITPLFQLNLMLWMVWSGSPAENTGIRPVFREAGFSLQSIAPPLNVSLHVQTVAARSDVPIKARVHPELLLRHSENRIFLLIECKLSSFGPDRDQANQATALLSFTGPELADYIGMSSASEWQAYLFYAVNDGSQKHMLNTLDRLSDLLEESQIPTIPAGIIGIAIFDDGVYIQALPHTGTPVGALNTSQPNWIRVMALDEGDDPRPLYLIPLDPSIDVTDPFGNRVLEERLRAAVVSVIGSRLDQPEFEVTEDEIMQAAIEVWDFWKERPALKALRKYVLRPFMNGVLSQLRNLDATVNRKDRTISFKGITPELTLSLRRYLSSAAFKQEEVWNHQLSLDDLLDERDSSSE